MTETPVFKIMFNSPELDHGPIEFAHKGESVEQLVKRIAGWKRGVFKADLTWLDSIEIRFEEPTDL